MNKFYMIYRDGNYPPTKKHDTFPSANAEAIRLASKHPEENFYILKAYRCVRGKVTIEDSMLAES